MPEEIRRDLHAIGALAAPATSPAPVKAKMLLALGTPQGPAGFSRILPSLGSESIFAIARFVASYVEKLTTLTRVTLARGGRAPITKD